MEPLAVSETPQLNHPKCLGAQISIQLGVLGVDPRNGVKMQPGNCWLEHIWGQRLCLHLIFSVLAPFVSCCFCQADPCLANPCSFSWCLFQFYCRWCWWVAISVFCNSDSHTRSVVGSVLVNISSFPGPVTVSSTVHYLLHCWPSDYCSLTNPLLPHLKNGQNMGNTYTCPHLISLSCFPAVGNACKCPIAAAALCFWLQQVQGTDRCHCSFVTAANNISPADTCLSECFPL